MAEELKVNAGKAVAVPLAAASQGVQAVSKLAAQHDLTGKISRGVGHPVLQQLSAQQDLILAVMGVCCAFYGEHFTRLFLCAQLFVTFLFVRVKSSVLSIYQDIQSISEQTQKDAAKAADKKDAKGHAEAATTVLKALDCDRITNATKEVLICLMATLLVLHGGLPQKVFVAHALVGAIGKRVDLLLHFEGFDGLESWTLLLVHFVLWLVFLPMSLLFPHLALILNIALAGASMATRFGSAFLVKIGKVPDAEALLGSIKGIGGYAALTFVGYNWQFWSYVAGSTLPWYFTLAFSPFVIAEGFLSLL